MQEMNNGVTIKEGDELIILIAGVPGKYFVNAAGVSALFTDEQEISITRLSAISSGKPSDDSLPVEIIINVKNTE